MTWLIILNVLAQVADYASTKRVLRNGGQEKNPVARYVLNRFGLGIWAGMKLVGAVVIVLLFWPVVWPGLLFAAIFIAVAVRNWRLIRNA